MDMGNAFLVSVGQLLLLANIAAAGTVIVFFAMFVVDLADSGWRTWFRGFTGAGLARKPVAARIWKKYG
jgi:hypothetical protein